MTRRQRKLLYTLAGVAISAILLWSLFRNIDFVELASVLQGANYYWLIPNILLVMFAMPQRAYRWRVMIAPIKNVKFSKLMAATCIGFMANNVLPLRLGEFVRAYSLSSQDKDVTKSASLANIFVERMVFDLVALLGIFGVVLMISRLPISEQIRVGITLATAIALIGLAFMLALALKPSQSGELIVKYLSFLPDAITFRIRNIIIKFSRGLEFLADSRMVLNVSIQTVVLWLFMGLSNYFVFMAFGFDLPLTASYVLLVVVSISILIPSTPGFVGVYHYGAVWTMTAYGIGKENALSFALVLHAAQFIPITLMGFYYLKKEHLSLKKLEKEAAEEID
jgi:uncharacterized protein (TIRG00374 family)